jgi:hypothetical protein
MRLDGFAILKAVAGHAELFSDARDIVDKAALNILAAQLKAKTFDLDRLKGAQKAVGPDTLALVLEHLPDSIPKALVARIDPHHPKAGDGSAPWMRSHVVALAKGETRPTPKPQASTKTKADAGRGKKRPKPEDDFVVQDFWATSVMAKPSRKTRGKTKDTS